MCTLEKFVIISGIIIALNLTLCLILIKKNFNQKNTDIESSVIKEVIRKQSPALIESISIEKANEPTLNNSWKNKRHNSRRGSIEMILENTEYSKTYGQIDSFTLTNISENDYIMPDAPFYYSRSSKKSSNNRSDGTIGDSSDSENKTKAHSEKNSRKGSKIQPNKHLRTKSIN